MKQNTIQTKLKHYQVTDVPRINIKLTKNNSNRTKKEKKISKNNNIREI